MGRWSRASVLAMACALSLPGGVAFAQAVDGDDGGLEDVVITAERRETNLQDVAVSASVLSGELLEDKGVRELYDIQYAAPSVNISGFGSANLFNIRGVGRSQVDIDVPSGVVIYRDGAPTVAGYFQREPYFDIGSVEVYRGPQGTFVGKSAAGGAVFINTHDPVIGDSSRQVEVGFGNYDLFEATGIANIPLTDTLAARFAVHHEQRDDFYDSVTGNFTGHPGEVDTYSYRLGLLWEPSPDFNATLKVDYHDLDFGGNVTTQYGDDPLGDVVLNMYGGPIAYRDRSTRVVLNLNKEFGNGVTLNSRTAFQHVDTVNNLDASGGLAFYSNATVNIVTQEFNLTSDESGPFRWVVGAFLESQDVEVPSWRDRGFIFDLGGAYPFAGSPWDKSERTYAVFAHTEFDLSDQLTLAVGARYSDYAMDQRTEWLAGDTTVPLDFGQPGVVPFQLASPGGDYQEMQEGSVDWQVSLNYQANEDHLLYGLISRGHITGGINLFPGVDAPAFRPYDEMQVINYEAGWKASWMDDHLRTQLSAYYEAISDYQANFADSTGLVNNPLNRNAEDDSSVWGVELSAQLALGDFSMDLGIGYLQSELGTFANVTDPITAITLDLSGAQSPFSPEIIGNVGFAYDFHAGQFMITPRVDIAYTGETQAALWPDPQFTLDERTLVNGRLSLTPESEGWGVDLWVTNATDEVYIAGIQNNATLYYAAPPRQYGARLRVNF